MRLSRFISLTILVSVFAVVLGSVFSPYKFVPKQTPRPQISTQVASVKLLKPCVAFDTNSGSKKIILQINDVQAYAWRETGIQMISQAHAHNIPVVVSVMPAEIHTDEKLVQFLRENVCNLEIAQQGTRVSADPELKGLTPEQIKNRAIEGKSVLQWVLKTEVNTYVPSQNWYTWRALTALDEVGYNTVSVEGVLRNIQGVSSYKFWKKELKSADSIINECNYAFKRNYPCTVIVYPAHFEGEKYTQFSELLDELLSLKDAEFTTFSRLNPQ